MTVPDDLVSQLFASQIPVGVQLARHDHTSTAPINYVLTEAEKRAGTAFDLYWLTGVGAESLCLTGLSPMPIGLAEWHMELMTAARRLFALEPVFASFATELASAASLRIIARAALASGQGDLAAGAFAQSFLETGIVVPELSISEMELEPMSESYMAVWFLTVAHEVGHLLRDTGDLIPRDWIDRELARQLASFTVLPLDMRQRAQDDARLKPDRAPLGLNVLREESLADAFAASVVLQATHEIFWKSRRRVDHLTFVVECYAWLNAVLLVERCRATVSVLSTTRTDAREVLEYNLLHPVAGAVRMHYLLTYLSVAIADLDEVGLEPTAVEGVRSELERVLAKLAPVTSAIDTGLSRAMQYAAQGSTAWASSVSAYLASRRHPDSFLRALVDDARTAACSSALLDQLVTFVGD